MHFRSGKPVSTFPTTDCARDPREMLVSLSLSLSIHLAYSLHNPFSIFPRRSIHYVICHRPKILSPSVSSSFFLSPLFLLLFSFFSTSTAAGDTRNARVILDIMRALPERHEEGLLLRNHDACNAVCFFTISIRLAGRRGAIVRGVGVGRLADPLLRLRNPLSRHFPPLPLLSSPFLLPSSPPR